MKKPSGETLSELARRTVVATPTGGSAVNYSYQGGGTADGDGHVTGRGANTFAWDGLGRLTSAVVGGKSACYSFGPDGALRTRLYDAGGSTTCATATTTRNYLLGGSFETNASGTILTSYDDGPAGDLASFNGPPTPSSTATYLYYNGHGDLAAEATGATIVTHTYDAWGTPLDAPPANTTTHRYTGAWDKQYDTTTSLVLMGARPYDPATGRFLATDPIDGGSLNNYDYAGQDPVNGYDLNGTAVLNPDDTISPMAACLDCDGRLLKNWGKTKPLGEIAKGTAEVAVVATIAAVGAAAIADTPLVVAPTAKVISEVGRRLATEAALRAANATLANMPRFGRCVQNAVAAYRATSLPGAPLWFRASYIVMGCLD